MAPRDGGSANPRSIDDAWLRALGVIAVVLALLMMLVAQRLEDVWWWAWAFVVLEAGTATVFMLHALFGLPDGASTWSWWLLAIVNGAFAALDWWASGSPRRRSRSPDAIRRWR